MNKILNTIDIKGLYDYIKETDLTRNEMILKELLKKKPSKAIIESAKKRAEKLRKLNLHKKLLEYKN
jgi:hypothetical protein